MNKPLDQSCDFRKREIREERTAMYTFCIAEDEYYVQKSIAARIRAMNVELECLGCAFTGEDALALYDRFHPDLFFVDINMPQSDGITFIERIRERDKDCRTLFIIISGYSDYRNMHRAIRVDVFDYLQKPIVPDEFAEMLNRALAHIADDRKDKETAEHAVRQDHSAVSREKTGGESFAHDERKKESADTSAERIDLICQYIQENYADDISVRTLAEVFYMSPSHVSHIFKKQMGVSPGKYLEDIRLSQAEQLLKNTDLLVADIAERVGYRDGNYFTKCFRKKYRVSPSEIRKKAGLYP